MNLKIPYHPRCLSNFPLHDCNLHSEITRITTVQNTINDERQGHKIWLILQSLTIENDKVTIEK